MSSRESRGFDNPGLNILETYIVSVGEVLDFLNQVHSAESPNSEWGHCDCNEYHTAHQLPSHAWNNGDGHKELP